jgi:hypothetical protein
MERYRAEHGRPRREAEFRHPQAEPLDAEAREIFARLGAAHYLERFPELPVASRRSSVRRLADEAGEEQQVLIR